MFPLAMLAAAIPPPPVTRTFADVVRQVVDECRNAADRAIIVCGRRDAESPYRLPPKVRDPGFQIDGPVDSVSRERHKLLEGGGDSGIGSCSTSGAGGWTGCMVKGWRQADQQRGFRPPKHGRKP